MELTNGTTVFTWAKVVSPEQTLQIRIIEYAFSCLELVFHDPVLGHQYPNIYLNCAILDQNILAADFKERFDEKRAHFVKNHHVVDGYLLRHHIRTQMMCEYVLSFLHVATDGSGNRSRVKIVLKRDPKLYRSNELVLDPSSISGKYVIPKACLCSV